MFLPITSSTPASAIFDGLSTGIGDGRGGRIGVLSLAIFGEVLDIVAICVGGSPRGIVEVG